ncbi:hypothetical protein RRG08_020430 [Elysia crispata]|uniref:Uncharacterized protein n=1 Tax=Elysia crispata TaxID=231223 RepID=A0AAE1EAN2_9GAST|nr:hypothetical protein RRG08_020430 [Elysia crispata]
MGLITLTGCDKSIEVLRVQIWMGLITLTDCDKSIEVLRVQIWMGLITLTECDKSIEVLRVQRKGWRRWKRRRTVLKSTGVLVKSFSVRFPEWSPLYPVVCVLIALRVYRPHQAFVSCGLCKVLIAPCLQTASSLCPDSSVSADRIKPLYPVVCVLIAPCLQIASSLCSQPGPPHIKCCILAGSNTSMLELRVQKINISDSSRDNTILRIEEKSYFYLYKERHRVEDRQCDDMPADTIVSRAREIRHEIREIQNYLRRVVQKIADPNDAFRNWPLKPLGDYKAMESAGTNNKQRAGFDGCCGDDDDDDDDDE